MREILFRGKRVDNGEWVEGSLTVNHYDRAGKLEDEYRIADTWYGLDDEDLPTYQIGLDEAVVPSTVGQYTGLTDKNGKKIFEGDIVRYPVYQGSYRGEDIHQVVFERRGGSAYFGITMDDIETWYFCMSVPADLMEVIGNIHDNPELIGGEKK